MTKTTTALPTGTWQLDPSATTITVAARKLGMFTIPAELTVTSGAIEIDSNQQVVTVAIEADAASYKSRNAKRNEHVLSDHLLDAGAHPTISFQTGAVVPTDDGDYSANGTVTIKGQTSPVVVSVTDVQFTGSDGSFTASATIDRKAIGVSKFPAFFIGRNLQLSVLATATRET